MEGPESTPYVEIETLCNLFAVRFDVYDAKGSLQRVIQAIQRGRVRGK